MAILAGIIAVLVVGLFVNRRLLGSSTHDAEGLSVTDLVGIIPTISVLLLAFVLVESFTSWKGARAMATSESSAIIALARQAHLAEAEGGAPVVRDVMCYTRAVRYVEWDAMKSRSASTAPEYWLDEIKREIEDLPDRDSAAGLLDRERELGEARVQRLLESLPSVPSAMFGLLVVSVLLSVFALAVLTHASVRTPIQLLALLSSTIMLTATLLLIREIDKPYSGPTAVAPTAIKYAQDEVQEELAQYTQRAQPPCDKRGHALREGAFEDVRENIV